MSREVIGYVIREGKVRGQGRYLSPKRGNDWVESRAKAEAWTHKMKETMTLLRNTERVVAIVRKAKSNNELAVARQELAILRGTDVSLWISKYNIAIADQQRAEESKAAAWEQVRGLTMKVAELEAQIAKAKQALG
jgi:hypothetical protein